MFGWSARSRFARPDAPPVAQRMNSSTAASNDSVRASTSSRSAVQDGNPCSRATTDCASWSARSRRRFVRSTCSKTRAARRTGGARPCRAPARHGAGTWLASSVARDSDGQAAGAASYNLHAGPVVRMQAARRCRCRWLRRTTVGLALRANPRAPFVRARSHYPQRRRMSIGDIQASPPFRGPRRQPLLCCPEIRGDLRNPIFERHTYFSSGCHLLG